MTIVQVQAATKIFASTGTQALRQADLNLEAGAIHALVGENGAGKSTLARILCGFTALDGGQLLVDGSARHFAGHRDAELAGIGFVPQYSMLAEGLSVAENLVLGHEPRRFGFLYNRQRARRQAEQLCRQYGFSLNVDAPVYSLSAAKRREVEILRALARASRVLVLDEPTTVLSESESSHLLSLLKELKARGMAILYISHRAREILELADTLTVLRDGRVELVRPVAGLDECSLGQLIVNQSACPAFSPAASVPGAPVLELRGVEVAGLGADSLSGVDLIVHHGELVGVIAIGNNGLETLEAAASGSRLPDSGSVSIQGLPIAKIPHRQLRTRLLAYIPSRRDEQGLCLAMPIADNTLAKQLFFFRRADFLRGRQPARFVRTLLAKAAVKANPANPGISLSGGNRQRLLLARELELQAPLLVAANPTQGLDSATRYRLLDEIQKQRDAGTAVLLLSTDMEDIAAVADRAFVLYRGRLQALPADVMASENPAERLAVLLTGGGT